MSAPAAWRIAKQKGGYKLLRYVEAPYFTGWQRESNHGTYEGAVAQMDVLITTARQEGKWEAEAAEFDADGVPLGDSR